MIQYPVEKFIESLNHEQLTFIKHHGFYGFVWLYIKLNKL